MLIYSSKPVQTPWSYPRTQLAPLRPFQPQPPPYLSFLSLEQGWARFLAPHPWSHGGGNPQPHPWSSGVGNPLPHPWVNGVGNPLPHPWLS